MKTKIIILLIVISISTTLFSYIVIDSKGLLKKSSQHIIYIKNSNFKKLFKSFYIPRDYSQKEINIDKYVISNSLHYLFNNQLGKIEKYSIIKDASELKGIKGYPTGIAVGNKKHLPKTMINIFIKNAAVLSGEYDKNNLLCLNTFFKVHFKKFGTATIMFMNYTEDGSDFKIYRIDAILPQNNPKSLQIRKNFNLFIQKTAENLKDSK